MALVAVWPDPITGRIAFLTPNPAARLNGESDLDFANRIATKDAPAGVAYTLIDSALLPATFRWSQPNLCAWRLVAGAIVVDLPTARQIRRAEALADRDGRLPRVRAAQAAATEDGKTILLAALKARAVTLRGLEATIDAQLAAVADLATLSTFTPTELQQAD